MLVPFDPLRNYQDCLIWSAAAFEAGHVDVAYHLLMAALHCAEDGKDVGRLGEVAERARQLLQALDQTQADHRLSSRRSAARGTANVFDSAARTAEATIARLNAEALTGPRGRGAAAGPAT